jgi:Rrf2 family protein
VARTRAGGENVRVHVSAKADYAIRAALELARANGAPMKAKAVAEAQSIPASFLEHILLDLRHHGLVASQRGAHGGYRLAQSAEQITLAQVIRAVDGPLTYVRGTRPEAIDYSAGAESLKQVWIALRANVRAVLDVVTLADVASESLPADVRKIADDPQSWLPDPPSPGGRRRRSRSR